MRSASGPTASPGFRTRFGRDAHGGAAIEFGILAPLLLLMLLGTIEIGRAVNTDRHFTSAVATAGDLVAREEFLGTSDSGATANLNSMMDSIKHLMQPYDASSLKLGIYSVQASTTDASQTKVVWRYSYNGMDVPAECTSYALPPNLVGKGGSVIVVEAEYKYKSLFGSYVPGFSDTMDWSDKSYHSPRNSCVDYVEGDNCTNSC
ncbi:MAG: pilus assembly protein [Hyphomicrobium sp.]|uniref:TadE/TadG family type IV pilus assembly protein n=1 Tax=Hyphomicrobium sp. TaxID=82 RepID=UPI0022CC4913|nr:pilus assembly protein [Hyphomicrobium sp.]MBZ0211589.1 pilus assembly protein [Hyphomicrobium sp.]MCZ7596431.1 pilus assembly protein [Hyphomicrobium sp.]